MVCAEGECNGAQVYCTAQRRWIAQRRIDVVREAHALKRLANDSHGCTRVHGIRSLRQPTCVLLYLKI